MPVVLIHKHPSLMDECCNLINTEWPRSRTARMRSLQMSSDTLPTCLALVEENKVLGHSKVTAIPRIRKACFVESVVIHPQHRGKGLGKLIMKETEKFAASQDMETVYLSTIDQQEFYKKLGYTECAPVSIYGWTPLTNDCSEKLQKLSIKGKQKAVDQSSKKTKLYSSSITSTDSAVIPKPPPPPFLPPPPPPLPPHIFSPIKSLTSKIGNNHSRSSNIGVSSRKTYFKKQIRNINT